MKHGEDEGGERLDAGSTADVAADAMSGGADPSQSDADAPVDAEPPGEPRRARRRAQQRRRILDSARGIFFRDGFVDANLDEVAHAAGVAKGTLYRYFDSKAELYVAVLADNGEIFVDKLRDSIASSAGADPPDVIRRVARFYYDHWMSNRDYFQIFWAIENQPVIGELPEGVIEEVAKLWELMCDDTYLLHLAQRFPQEPDLLIGIVNGSERFEGSVMPAFGNVLTDDQIVDILEYIKAWWGEEERMVQWRVSQRAGG